MRVDEHIFDNVHRMPLHETVKCEMAAPSTTRHCHVDVKRERCVKKPVLLLELQE